MPRLIVIVAGGAVEAVDDVGQEDCEAVEVVEEAVYAEGRVVAGGPVAVLLLELAHVLTRREPGAISLHRGVRIPSFSGIGIGIGIIIMINI